MDYKDAIKIDRDNLHLEAERLPEQFDELSTKEQELIEIIDILKDKIQLLRAKIGLDVRSWDLAKINTFFGLKLEKLTEETYKQLPLVHPTVLELYDAVHETKTILAAYQTARKSFECKDRMIDRLTRLHAQSYFIRNEKAAMRDLKIDFAYDAAQSNISKRLAEINALTTKPTNAPVTESQRSRMLADMTTRANKIADTVNSVPTSKTPKSTKPSPIRRIKGT